VRGAVMKGRAIVLTSCPELALRIVSRQAGNIAIATERALYLILSISSLKQMGEENRVYFPTDFSLAPPAF